MPRYIPLSFLLLAWVFYEMSGGSDFEPTVVAEAKPVLKETAITVEPLEKVRRERAEASIALANTRVVEPVPVSSTEPPNPPATQNQSATADEEPRVRLRSTLPVFAAVTGDASEQIQTISLSGLSEIAPSPTNQPEEVVRAPVAETADLREVIASRVNMRAGPGTSHEILDRLTRGQSVEILGDNGQGWLRLRTLPDDRVGWIAERLISRAAN